MDYLIEKGLDAPHQPRVMGDVPIFKDGRLIGVKRRVVQFHTPPKSNSAFRVLVVNDTRDMADLCAECLASWGFQVATAYGGQAGLEAAQEMIPDLILLNYLMPGLNGLQIMQLLRADSRTTRIKVIFRMGADDFLLLPFEPKYLLEKVSRAVRS
jgi:CheY-like chemotaxis protein